ncbi:MAG: 50S ribosomal protein L11 methyltransferase [Bdellovibrionota bacterium]|nr:MAG: 50S ribosomal protein L11 methyltransferase [Bdellovibrionota bacterium]
MTTDAPWWSLTFLAPDIDLLTTIAFTAGASGVHELDQDHLRAYVRGSAEEAAQLACVLGQYGAARITTEQVVVQDWLRGGWTDPRQVGAFTLHPMLTTGETESRADHIALIPGMGFGTGDHATTAMILEAMSRIPVPTSGRILDIGTGSGVLAIAAVKLWKRPVLAIDIDDDALANALENAQMNCAADMIRFEHRSLSELPEEAFPVVLANLYAELLAEFEPLLARRCAQGGYALLSGVLEKLDPVIRQAFSPPLWRCVEVVARAGWMGYVFTREVTHEGGIL